jgi:hypothetical protein
MPRSLVTALLATVALLLATPAAHAGWLTAGNEFPPLISSDAACKNGMVFRYAMVRTDWTQPAPYWLTLDDLVVLKHASTDPYAEPLVTDVIHNDTYAVPYNPTPITGTYVPARAFGPGPVDVYDYYVELLLPFSTEMPPGARVQLQWRRGRGGTYDRYRLGHSYAVADCVYTESGQKITRMPAGTPMIATPWAPSGPRQMPAGTVMSVATPRPTP